MEEKKCVICGWNKKVEEHHLQKYVDWGLDTKENLVYLCPNHHWIADFGTEEDRTLLLIEIKKITGKEPIINIIKKEYLEKLMRCSFEEQFGEMDEKKWEEFKGSWNYEFTKKIINSRNNLTERLLFIKKLEIKYLISKLKKELGNIPNSN